MSAKLDDWKIKERISLFNRCYYWSDEELVNIGEYLNIEWFSELKPSYGGFYLDSDDKRRAVQVIANTISDEQIADILNKIKPKYDFSFRGKYYTFENGKFELKNSWERVKQDVKNLLIEAKPKVSKRYFAFLKALTELCESKENYIWHDYHGPSWSELIRKMGEIAGKAVTFPAPQDYAALQAYGLYFKGGSNNYPTHCIPFEIIPVVKEALKEWEGGRYGEGTIISKNVEDKEGRILNSLIKKFKEEE